MVSQSFTVDITKTTGTVLTTQTTALTIHADSDAAARRMAIEMLNDDQSDIDWSTATTAPSAGGAIHITSVTNNVTKIVTK